MTLHLHLTPGDDAPLYRQLTRQIAEAVATGAIEPGERLPSLRELSQRLVVAPLTIKKAYDELEREGLVESRRGQGTFVSASAQRSEQSSAERLRPLIRRLLLEAELGGIDAAQLQLEIEQEWNGLRAERASQGGTQ